MEENYFVEQRTALKSLFLYWDTNAANPIALLETSHQEYALGKNPVGENGYKTQENIGGIYVLIHEDHWETFDASEDISRFLGELFSIS